MPPSHASLHEKLAAPDAVARAPLFAMDSHMRMDPTTGARGTGTDEIIDSTSFSDLRQSALSSASQRVSTAQEGFSQTMSSTLGASWNKASESNHTEGFSQGMASNYSKTWGQVENLTDQIQSKFGLSHEDARQIAGNAALGGGASVGKGVGANGSIEGKASASGGDKEDISRAVDWANSMAQSQNFQAGLARSMQSDIADGVANRSGFSLSDQDSKALSRASDEVASAQESCTATDTTTQGRQGNTSVSDLAVVNAAGREAIGTAVAGRHLQASQNEYYGNYAGMAKRGALTHEQAAGLAGLDALRYSEQDFNRSPGADGGAVMLPVCGATFGKITQPAKAS